MCLMIMPSGWPAVVGAAWFSVLASGITAADDAPAPREMTIAEFVTQFPAGEDAITSPELVRLHGRVISGTPNDVVFTIEDDTAGLNVYVGEFSAIYARWPEIAPTVRLGAEIVIDGVARTVSARPGISAVDVRVRSQGDPPPAPPADLVRLWSGADLQRRLTIEGVVQSSRDEADATEGLGRSLWQLRVLCESRTVPIFLHKEVWPDDPRPLLDARVRVTGVTGPFRNTKGEFLGPWFTIARPQDVEVIEPPPADPFAGELRPLTQLRTYRPKPPSGHRIRARGTVTLSSPANNSFVIQEGLAGGHVRLSSGDVPAVGDRVEVAGFIDMARNVAALSGAVVRHLGHSPLPEAIEITPDEIMQINLVARKAGAIARPSSYEGCRVRFQGRVIESAGTAGGPTPLRLVRGDSLVDLALPEPEARALSSIPVGADVQVTGVVQLAFAADEGPTPPDLPSRLTLLLPAAADVIVLRRPSWWTAGRLTAALMAVAVALSIATGWAAMLRRQVARQLAVIETKLQAEAAAEERRRIAQEFHDTLEQDLAGITLQIDAAAHRAADAGTRAFLEEQHALLARLRADTHDFLWDLRDPTRNQGALLESAAAQVAYLRTLTDVPIEFAGDSELPRVGPAVQFHVLRMMREAVTNAVRHAESGRITVRLGRAAGGVVLEVADDGRGFDVPSREAVVGHFGIRGMQERARRIGAEITIDSRPGAGTRLTVTVPEGKAGANPEGNLGGCHADRPVACDNRQPWPSDR